MSNKALIFWGGWDGHKPAETSAIFADLLRQGGLDVDVTQDMSVLEDAERLAACRLIVPNVTMSKISGAQVGGLWKAVQGGVGLAGAHGGMGDAFRESCEFQYMVGGQFVGHPDNHQTYTVRITKRHDPVVAGLADFEVYSEFYYMHTDPSNDVLAAGVWKSTTNPWIDNVVMPIVWKRLHGAGRVFYNSLGHAPEIWSIPAAREIQKRGMLWAAGVAG